MRRVVGAAGASAAAAAAAATHTLWLRSTFASRIETATHASLRSGADPAASAGALAIKHELQQDAKLVVVSGCGSAAAVSALAADQSVAGLRTCLLQGSLLQALSSAFEGPRSARFAVISRHAATF